MAADTYSEINALDSLGSTDGSTDLIVVGDFSATTSKKSTRNTYLGLASAPLGTTDTQSPTNKTFDNSNVITVRDDRLTIQDSADTTKQLQFQLSGITTGTTRTLTIPNASTTLVGTDATQTLTNKTLTSPTINTPTISNPTLTVDSIAEHTAANGVSVDGMLIKDGTVGPGVITPAGLVTGAGSTWVWQDWTPTWVNLTVGNGTLTAKYVQHGKTIIGSISLVFGSTTAISGAVTFTLPQTAAARYSVKTAIGELYIEDAGTVAFSGGQIRTNSTTTASLNIGSANTTYVQEVGFSSTVPMTWTTNDLFAGTLMYERS